MDRYFFVFLGGGMGAVARYVVGTFVARFYSSTFPLATFLINVTGSFLIGILMTLFQNRPALHPDWRLFLVTGILGGYTTFSSFEWEALMAFQNGAAFIAFSYLSGSALLGLGADWLGWFVSSRLLAQ